MLNEQTVRLSLRLLSRALDGNVCEHENDSTNIARATTSEIRATRDTPPTTLDTLFTLHLFALFALCYCVHISMLVTNFTISITPLIDRSSADPVIPDIPLDLEISETFLDPSTFNDSYARSSFAPSQPFPRSGLRCFVVLYEDVRDGIVDFVFQRTRHETELESGTARSILEESDHVPER